MKLTKPIFKYFGSELVTCLSTVALIISVSILTKHPITWDFLTIILFSSLAVYFFDFFDDSSDYEFEKKSEETTIVKDKTFFKVFITLLLFASLIISWMFGTLISFLLLTFLIILGILYPLFLKKISKRIVGFKDFFVAVLWNGMVILYFQYYAIPITSSVLLLLLLIFTRDFMGASFCDLKDINSDARNGLRTLAVFLSQKKLYYLLYLLNSLSVIVIIFGVMFNLLPTAALILILPVILTTFFITLAARLQNFSEVFIDYEYSFWLILLLIYHAKL